MSSNNPLIDSIEDNNQEQKMAKTKVSFVDKSGSASSVTEKTEKVDNDKISVPSLDKSGSDSQTEIERTEKKKVKKDPYNYPVQMITNWQNRTQKT